MSYVLHIWEKPDTTPWPASVEEASRLAQGLQSANATQAQCFTALAKRLTARYPCICSEEAEGIPESQWAWSDGPLNGDTDKAVYSIGLNLAMLAEVRPFVLDQVKALGLNVVDEQAGEAHLANGAVLVSGNPGGGATPRSEYDLVPKCSDLERIVFERLTPFMKSFGYKARKSNLSFKSAFPGGWHEISLITTDRWPLQVQYSLGVSSRFDAVNDLVDAITQSRLPPKELKQRRTTVAGQLRWMDEANFFQNTVKEYEVDSFEKIHATLDHLLDKLEKKLMPMLERYKTIQGLDELINPDPVTDSVYFYGYDMGFFHIIAAYLAGNPRLPILCDQFLTENAKRSGFSHAVEHTRMCIEYVRNNPLPKLA